MVEMNPHTTQTSPVLYKPEVNYSVLLGLGGIKVTNNVLALDSYSLAGKLTAGCKILQGWYCYSVVETSITIYSYILLVFVNSYCKVLSQGISS